MDTGILIGPQNLYLLLSMERNPWERARLLFNAGFRGDDLRPARRSVYGP